MKNELVEEKLGVVDVSNEGGNKIQETDSGIKVVGKVGEVVDGVSEIVIKKLEIPQKLYESNKKPEELEELKNVFEAISKDEMEVLTTIINLALPNFKTIDDLISAILLFGKIDIIKKGYIFIINKNGEKIGDDIIYEGQIEKLKSKGIEIIELSEKEFFGLKTRIKTGEIFEININDNPNYNAAIGVDFEEKNLDNITKEKFLEDFEELCKTFGITLATVFDNDKNQISNIFDFETGTPKIECFDINTLNDEQNNKFVNISLSYFENLIEHYGEENGRDILKFFGIILVKVCLKFGTLPYKVSDGNYLIPLNTDNGDEIINEIRKYLGSFMVLLGKENLFKADFEAAKLDFNSPENFDRFVEDLKIGEKERKFPQQNLQEGEESLIVRLEKEKQRKIIGDNIKNLETKIGFIENRLPVIVDDLSENLGALSLHKVSSEPIEINVKEMLEESFYSEEGIIKLSDKFNKNFDTYKVYVTTLVKLIKELNGSDIIKIEDGDDLDNFLILLERFKLNIEKLISSINTNTLKFFKESNSVPYINFNSLEEDGLIKEALNNFKETLGKINGMMFKVGTYFEKLVDELKVGKIKLNPDFGWREAINILKGNGIIGDDDYKEIIEKNSYITISSNNYVLLNQ